jgi:WD40 repeat protein
VTVAAPRAADGTDGNTIVQQAVEDFVDRCTTGEAPDPAGFATAWPEPLRERIAEQCRRFLAFDDLVGRQRWDDGDLVKPDGRQFGDFVIKEELGRGGMGIVYLAHQRSLNRRVALKVMASGLTLSKRHVERFRREATAAAQLRHPGIVPVHSFTEVDGTFAFAMDYIAGRNLGEILDDLRLANGPQPAHVEGTLGMQPEKGYVAECALLCAQLASALAAAHGSGIAHRDIKPRNVMLDDRRQARLLDFGLAKSLDHGSISLSGEITGTAHYMSPEQTLAKRVPLDHRTDIFSLGVILYELLTLRRPFDGRNLQQIVYEICFKEPPPVQKLNPKVPRDLVTICQKALEKDPQNRYQTAEEFEADLQRFLRWEPVHARPAGWLSRLAKWTHRHRTETATALLLAAAGLAAAGIAWYRTAERRARSDELMGKARDERGQRNYEAAIAHATEALALSSEPTVQQELELLRAEQQRMVAETNLLLMSSGQALERDRELALVLALQAVDRHDSHFARSAVLDALGAGYHTRRFAAGQQVVKAVLSADGQQVATAALDGPAALWDAATGERQFLLEGHGRALDLRFHPDGMHLATSHEGDGVVFWSRTTGRDVRRIAHDGPVEIVRFDQGGARLLTFSYVNGQTGPFTLQLWDGATGARVASSPTRYLEVAALSPDGRWFASCGDPASVRIWDTTADRELRQIADHGVRVRDLAFSPDSRLLATACSDGRARVYSVADGALVRRARHSKDIDTVCFDPKGERLLTGSRDQTARIWNLHLDAGPRGEATEETVLNGHAGTVRRAAFDPSGLYVVTACEDALVRVFDASNGAELMHYEVGRPVEDASFDGDGGRVLIVAGREHALLWDLDGTRGTVTLRHKSFVRTACFDSTGEHALTAGDDECLRVWNARDGRLEATIPGLGDPVEAIDVDPHSQRVLVATHAGKVGVYTLYDRSLLNPLAGHQKTVHAARFAADGERVITCSEDGSAAVWNARDATPICRIEGLRPVVAVDLAPDGSLLATVEDGAEDARLWTVPGKQERRRIGRHAGAVRAVAFLPDGTGILTAGDDGRALLWSLDGRLRLTFEAGVPLHRAVFARTGDTLLLCSGAAEPVAQLWDVETGLQRLSFRGHRGEVVGGAISADGAWAMTCSKDHTAQIWPTDPVAVARQLTLRELTPAERQAFGLPAAAPPAADVPPAASSRTPPAAGPSKGPAK